MIEFIECASCKAKVGSPTLCESCLSNRSAIAVQRAVIEQLESTLGMIGQLVKLAYSTEPNRPHNG